MILAIDFDDTIHNTRDVQPGYKMGKPIYGAKEALKKLASTGNTIIIHTIWAETEQKRRAIQDWLRYFDIPYNDITSQKPKADAYIDDKGIHFDTWYNVMSQLGYANPQ